MTWSERLRLIVSARLLLDAAYGLPEGAEDAFAELVSRAARNIDDARRPVTRAGNPAQDLDRWTAEGRER